MMELPEAPSSLEQIQEASLFIKKQLPSVLETPKVAIVCGSGLGGLESTIRQQPRVEIEYASIPHFPRLTVSGHAGKLVFGLLDKNIPAVLMVGRAHYYEGHSISRVTFPIRVFKLLGVDTLVCKGACQAIWDDIDQLTIYVLVTNAAGGLNPDYGIGDIVMLNDHIFLAGFAGVHPLRGPNLEELGPRFPPLSDAYDLELRRQVHQGWNDVVHTGSKRKLHEGVYAFVGGPSYETRAECRMLRQLGADLVGMSTVPEIIVARHCGIRIIALSLVTNNAVLSPVPRGDDILIQDHGVEELDAILKKGKASHEEVLEEGRSAALDMQNLVVHVISRIFNSN